jgi:hypothetical protein
MGEVVAMRVEDYYPEGKRWWFRLREKGGKRHEVPVHHNAEAYMDAYLEAASPSEPYSPAQSSACWPGAVALDAHGRWLGAAATPPAGLDRFAVEAQGLVGVERSGEVELRQQASAVTVCTTDLVLAAEIDRKARLFTQRRSGEVVVGSSEPALVQPDADGEKQDEQSVSHGNDLPYSLVGQNASPIREGGHASPGKRAGSASKLHKRLTLLRRSEAA